MVTLRRPKSQSSPSQPVEAQYAVLDASAVIAFAVHSESLHSNAVALVRQLAAEGTLLIAPSLFDYEVATVLRLKVFRHLTKARNAVPYTEEDALCTEQIVAALQITTVHDAEAIARASQIARDYGQARIYDASYAAFAQSRSLDYWTADEDFFMAVNGPTLPVAKRLSFVHYIGSIHPSS